MSFDASLEYLGTMQSRPQFNVYDRRSHNLNLEAHSVRVCSGRSASGACSLEREGFQLARHSTQVPNLESRKAVLLKYRAEVQDVIRQLTGASLAIAEPLGVIRSGEEKGPQARPVHAPIRFVHADFSPRSAWEQIQRFLPPEEALAVSRQRFAIYNAWRVLTPPPQDLPLAVCDLRTVNPDDAVCADTILDFPGSRSGTREVMLFRFNRDHLWYVFEDMTADELLIFKAFDSSMDGLSQVPHCAFPMPSASGAVPRLSLDIRVLAAF